MLVFSLATLAISYTSKFSLSTLIASCICLSLIIFPIKSFLVLGVLIFLVDGCTIHIPILFLEGTIVRVTITLEKCGTYWCIIGTVLCGTLPAIATT